MHIFKNTNFDFLRWRWHAIVLSWVVILAGAFVFFTKGIPLGVEFAGGTSVIARFESDASIGAVRGAVAKTVGADIIVQDYGDPADHQFMIRVPHVGEESGTSLSNTSGQIQDALKGAGVGNFEIVGTEIVGPAVGQELRSRGLWAT